MHDLCNHLCTAKILPLVYDNTLSYYEVLCKIAHKVDVLADDVAGGESIPLAWKTDESKNIVAAGSDLSALLNRLTTGLGIPAGSYTITSDVSCSVPLFIADGVTLKVSDGVSVQFLSGILAPRSKIFDGYYGGIQIYKVPVYPEWFGAVTDGTTDCSYGIQRAIDACYSGDVLLCDGEYSVDTDGYNYIPDGKTCYLCKTGVKISGYPGGRVRLHAIRQGVIFGETQPIITLGDYDTYTEGAEVDHLFIYHTGDKTPDEYSVACYNVTRSSVHDCRIYNQRQGVLIDQTNNFEVTNNEIFSYFVSEVVDQGCGIMVGALGTGTHELSGSANASLVIANNKINLYKTEGITNGVGIQIYGSDIRDSFLRYNDIANTKYGIFIASDTSLSPGYAYDIHLDGNVIDQHKQFGIVIQGLNHLAAQVSIIGGYTSGGDYDNVVSANLAILDANCVSVTNHQFLCNTMSRGAGLYLLNASGVTLSGCTFTNAYRCIQMLENTSVFMDTATFYYIKDTLSVRDNSSCVVSFDGNPQALYATDCVVVADSGWTLGPFASGGKKGYTHLFCNRVSLGDMEVTDPTGTTETQKYQGYFGGSSKNNIFIRTVASYSFTLQIGAGGHSNISVTLTQLKSYLAAYALLAVEVVPAIGDDNVTLSYAYPTSASTVIMGFDNVSDAAITTDVTCILNLTCVADSLLSSI